MISTLRNLNLIFSVVTQSYRFLFLMLASTLAHSIATCSLPIVFY